MASRGPRPAALAAFVLHRYDWSESSVILDLFTREQGRIAVAAKGAKRPFSQLRSVLLPFQRLQVTLGREPPGDDTREVQTLRAAEWAGGHADAHRRGALQRLLLERAVDEAARPARPARRALRRLRRDGRCPGTQATRSARKPALRAFELVLLREIGLLPDLGTETASHRPVRADRRYLVLADAGVVETEAGSENEASVSGAMLSALEMALAVDLAFAAARRRRRARRAAAAAARAASLSSRHFATAHPASHDRSAGARAMNPLMTTGPGRAPRHDRALGQREQDRAAAQPAPARDPERRRPGADRARRRRRRHHRPSAPGRAPRPRAATCTRSPPC